tara:strand:- start:109 stop:345 length:237 start_codon:yes stop_codon:yes gene_type:complete
MKLFEVTVEEYYDASYEGDINTSYTRLVIANNIDEAIDVVKNGLPNYDNTCSRVDGITAIQINLDQIKRKRVPGYYKK